MSSSSLPPATDPPQRSAEPQPSAASQQPRGPALASARCSGCPAGSSSSPRDVDSPLYAYKLHCRLILAPPSCCRCRVMFCWFALAAAPCCWPAVLAPSLLEGRPKIPRAFEIFSSFLDVSVARLFSAQPTSRCSPRTHDSADRLLSRASVVDSCQITRRARISASLSLRKNSLELSVDVQGTAVTWLSLHVRSQ